MPAYSLTLTWDNPDDPRRLAELATEPDYRQAAYVPEVLTRASISAPPPPVSEPDLEVQADDSHSHAGTPHMCTGETPSLVRVRHLPTGIEVSCDLYSSQIENKAACLAAIQAIVPAQRSLPRVLTSTHQLKDQAEQPQLVLKLTPAQAAIVCGALWRETRKALKDRKTLVRKFGDRADIARQDARLSVSARLHVLLSSWLEDLRKP